VCYLTKENEESVHNNKQLQNKLLNCSDDEWRNDYNEHYCLLHAVPCSTVDRHVCPVGNCCFYLQGRRKMDGEGSSAMLVRIFQITTQNFQNPIISTVNIVRTW
jgi:hypothetical protein